jgi:hypothetical protein
MTKNKNTKSDFKNKRMNESVYAERRVIIDLIYRVKNLLRTKGIQLPRIDVRIVDADRSKTTSIGRARMRDNIIWIPADSLVKYSKQQYQIVLHELLHAVWGVEHDQKCLLMHTNLQELTDSKAENIFLEYAIKLSPK